MTNGSRSAACAKQRLRQKLQARSKQHEGDASAGEQSSCPLQPPADPDVLEMVAEAGQLIHKNKKEASRLYHLAAKKGYTPAFVLLANHARNINDEPLAIEALFSLLQSKEASRQIPAALLQNHVGELVMLLNQEKHAAEALRRKQDIDELSRTWPMFKEIENFKEAQDVLSSIKSLMLKSQIEELVSRPIVDNSNELPSQAQACTAQAVIPEGPVDEANHCRDRALVSSNFEMSDVSANIPASKEHLELLARVKSCIELPHDDGTPGVASASTKEDHALRRGCHGGDSESDACASITAMLNSSNDRAEWFARIKSCNESLLGASEELSHGNSGRDVAWEGDKKDHAEILALVRQACSDSTHNADTSDKSNSDGLLEGTNTTHAELVARVKQTCSKQPAARHNCNEPTRNTDVRGSLLEGGSAKHAELVARVKQTCSKQPAARHESKSACTIAPEAAINLMD